jgi:hypothetical protein
VARVGSLGLGLVRSQRSLACGVHSLHCR